MKRTACWLVPLALTVGCGRDPANQAWLGDGYPRLNESPPPMPVPTLLADDDGAPGDLPRVNAPTNAVPGEIPDAVGFTERLMQEQVQRLRAHAAQADPDDPFALSEEDILEFARRGDPIMF